MLNDQHNNFSMLGPDVEEIKLLFVNEGSSSSKHDDAYDGEGRGLEWSS